MGHAESAGDYHGGQEYDSGGVQYDEPQASISGSEPIRNVEAGMEQRMVIKNGSIRFVFQ